MFTVLLVLFAILTFWQFLGYPLSMFVAYKKDKKHGLKKDYSYQPFLRIIVLAYNEEQIIKRRIENLLSQHYPGDRFEVIVVDSGSTDSTLWPGEIMSSETTP